MAGGKSGDGKSSSGGKPSSKSGQPGNGKGPGRAPGKSKTPGKVKASPSGRKAGKKKSGTAGFWSKAKPYLLGLSLGLLIGGLGAILMFYVPRAIQPVSPPRPAAERPAARPPAERKPSQASAKPPASGTSAILYEENHSLGNRIKEMDQALYLALRDLKIPERDIHFAKVTSRTDQALEWEHSLLELTLPQGLRTEDLVKRLKTGLASTGLTPSPRVETVQGGNGPVLNLSYAGVPTHTLVLLPPNQTSGMEKVKAASGSARPKTAIIVDDFGENTSQVQRFLEVEAPLAFSVLPFRPHTGDAARMAHAAGRVVMVHLPMQPAGWPGINPGPGALLVSMGKEEVQARVRAALDAVPYASGVNNHMGSRFTEDQEKMGWVLEEVKRRGMFFVDSRTSARSRAYQASQRLGVPSARRSIFVDNIQEPEAVGIQLRKLATYARQYGQSVGIGHPYGATCQSLKKEYNYLNSKVDLVSITSLLR